jgi:hypothetical protein
MMQWQTSGEATQLKPFEGDHSCPARREPPQRHAPHRPNPDYRHICLHRPLPHRMRLQPVHPLARPPITSPVPLTLQSKSEKAAPPVRAGVVHLLLFLLCVVPPVSRRPPAHGVPGGPQAPWSMPPAAGAAADERQLGPPHDRPRAQERRGDAVEHERLCAQGPGMPQHRRCVARGQRERALRDREEDVERLRREPERSWS